MGMQNTMRASPSRTANFATKLVMATDESVRARAGVGLRPVIDGAFIYSPDVELFIAVAHEVFAKLALISLKATQPNQVLMVRGGMAHGGIVVGGDIPVGCFYSPAFTGERQAPRRVDEVIFGQAVSDAYSAAESAPPFGVSVASSGADILTRPGGQLRTRQWQWWAAAGDAVATELAGYLKAVIEDYFTWHEVRPTETGYKPDRLALHRALFREHYRDVTERR